MISELPKPSMTVEEVIEGTYTCGAAEVAFQISTVQRMYFLSFLWQHWSHLREFIFLLGTVFSDITCFDPIHEALPVRT